MQRMTNSRRSKFATCRKSAWFAYELRLRPVSDGKALCWGLAFHDGNDALSTGDDPLARIATHADKLNAYDIAALQATTAAYAQHYGTDQYGGDPIRSEVSFRLPLVNPATGHKSKTFEVAGKIDAILPNAIRETKTTGSSLDDDRYWRRLLMDPQITLYYWAARELGYTVETVYYDVIRKPSMNPHLATHVEKRKYKKDGTPYANVRETDETPDEWYERLFADIMKRPDFYFARRKTPRTGQHVEELQYELWDVAKDYRQAQLNGRWYRNVSRMTCDYCSFFSICHGLTAWEPGETPEGFVCLEDPHPELGATDASSTTNSTAPEDTDAAAAVEANSDQRPESIGERAGAA